MLYHAHRNDFAVWFNSDSFYKPIFEDDFEVLKAGSSIRAELAPSYDVRHGFFFTADCEGFRDFDDLDGSFRYSFYSNGVKLESKNITIPFRTPKVWTSEGVCRIALFTFELPYKGHYTVAPNS